LAFRVESKEELLKNLDEAIYVLTSEMLELEKLFIRYIAMQIQR